MIRNNYTNPKINRSFILGRGFNFKTNSLKSKISYNNSTSKKNKNENKDISIENQKFLNSLINKTKYGKGFKIV
jgi:hypothetical protein